MSESDRWFVLSCTAWILSAVESDDAILRWSFVAAAVVSCVISLMMARKPR